MPVVRNPIPFLLMRGGTSRGLYFLRADLPQDEEELSATLIKVMGAGHPLNIDGLGGGSSVTTKVAILSCSQGVEEREVDYFFAQVAVEERSVDYAPTCGNVLVGVAPAAIETGLIEASEGRQSSARTSSTPSDRAS